MNAEERKKIEKFIEKNGSNICKMVNASGVPQIMVKTGLGMERALALQLVYHDGTNEIKKMISNIKNSEGDFIISFSAKGQAIIVDGNDVLFGGFEDKAASFLVLAVTTSVAVFIAFDSTLMEKVFVFCEINKVGRKTIFEFAKKLSDNGFCSQMPIIYQKMQKDKKKVTGREAQVNV